MTIRQHGTLAMRTRGECATNPCPPCLEAGRRAKRHQEKMKIMGRQPYVAAGKARQHVRRLLAGGMSVRQIEAVSGVHRTAIRVMLGDFPNRKRSERIRPTTHWALMAVQVDLGPNRGTATVDAVGTRRRLEALQAIGYSTRYLAARLGAGPKTPLQVARRDRVRAATARGVAALYTELECTAGPSRRVSITARARGFLTPAWWDAETIDDPNIGPDGIYTYRQSGRSLADAANAPRGARIDMLLRAGLSRQQVADRLGVPLRYVNRDIISGRAS